VTRVLVLGGTGFIGRHISNQLRADGASVVVTGRTSSNADVALDLLSPDAAHRLTGVADDEAVDCVVFSAGSADSGQGPQDLQVHALGIERLCTGLRAAKKPPRVVLVSSILALGHHRNPDVSGTDFGQRFHSPYPYFKFRAEQIVLGSGLDVRLVRPSLVTGDELTGRIPREQPIFELVRSILRAPAIPAARDAAVYLSPVNLVARDVSNLAVLEPDLRIVTSVDTRPFPLRTVLEALTIPFGRVPLLMRVPESVAYGWPSRYLLERVGVSGEWMDWLQVQTSISPEQIVEQRGFLSTPEHGYLERTARWIHAELTGVPEVDQ
jgi:nucleoside-diphosphate-sugar epimerase